MNRISLFLLFLTIAISSYAQVEKKDVWKSEKDYLKYQKSSKYKGPDQWYGGSPSSIKDQDYSNGGGYNSGQGGYGSQGGQGIQYSPQQIQRDRERYQGFDRGGGNGTVKHDPKVERPDPFDVPDVDAPDVPAPKVDAPDIPLGFWKFLLFLLIFAALVIIAYLIFKNKKPANKKVVVDVEEEWNPEVISKTELELRLEEAEARDDYRECVRIYFTFILKELISKGWIKWKKDKTNHHYLIEMSGKPNNWLFSECVRIYDLVWYGEYHIDRDIYELLRPELNNYYRLLEPKDE